MLEPEKVNDAAKHQPKMYKFSPKPPRRVACPTRHFLRRRKWSLRSHFLPQENVFIYTFQPLMNSHYNRFLCVFRLIIAMQ